MKIFEVATSCRSLADYIDKHGEQSDVAIIRGALKQIGERVTVYEQDRVSAMGEHLAEEEFSRGGR